MSNLNNPFIDTLLHKSNRESLITTIELNGINNPHILQAFRDVPRHWFVESAFTEQSYKDYPLPIAEGQTISQPTTVALQTQLLQLQKGNKVLEIGTGSGFQGAILVAMGIELYTIERNEVLFNQTLKLYQKLNIQATCILGDGTEGYLEAQPYDGILVTAAGPEVPKSLLAQLAIGGRMVIPIGNLKEQKLQVIQRINAFEFEIIERHNVRFVPLIGKEAWKESDIDKST